MPISTWTGGRLLFSGIYESLIIHVCCLRGLIWHLGDFPKENCIRIEQYSIVHVLKVNIFISRKARHSQLTSGAKWYMFWLSHLVSDLIIYAAPAIVSVIAIAITQAPYISGTPTEVYVIFFLNWTVPRNIYFHSTLYMFLELYALFSHTKEANLERLISHLKMPKNLYCGVHPTDLAALGLLNRNGGWS